MISRLAVLFFAALAISACARESVESSDSADEGLESGGLQISVTADGDVGRPPWEDFDVTVAAIAFDSTVEAIGELPDGVTSLIGTSCDELLDEAPEIVECTEETVTFPVRGTEQRVGRLNPDGTLNIPMPDVESDVSILGIIEIDNLCFWSGFVTVSPGETTAVVQIAEACA